MSKRSYRLLLDEEREVVEGYLAVF